MQNRKPKQDQHDPQLSMAGLLQMRQMHAQVAGMEMRLALQQMQMQTSMVGFLAQEMGFKMMDIRGDLQQASLDMAHDEVHHQLDHHSQEATDGIARLEGMLGQHRQDAFADRVKEVSPLLTAALEKGPSASGMFAASARQVEDAARQEQETSNQVDSRPSSPGL